MRGMGWACLGVLRCEDVLEGKVLLRNFMCEWKEITRMLSPTTMHGELQAIKRHSFILVERRSRETSHGYRLSVDTTLLSRGHSCWCCTIGAWIMTYCWFCQC